MKLRGQILLGVLLITVLPLTLVMQITRTGVTKRFTDLDTRRVEDQMLLTRQDLAARGTGLDGMLVSLGSTITADNRFRLAVGGGRDDLKPYLVDFAPRHMSLMNLDMLQIQNEAGQIVSSGHFRHSFGHVDAALPRQLALVKGGQALVPSRSAEGPFLALARSRQITLGGKKFDIVGGIRLDSSHLRDLSRDDDLDVVVAWSGGLLSTSEKLSRELAGVGRPEEIPFHLRKKQAIVRVSQWPLIQDGQSSDAYLIVTHSQASLKQAVLAMNIRMGIILALAVAASVFLSILLANRISRPLRDLSERARDLDFNRLDIRFESTRKDEVGHLTRLLGEMTARLRTGVNKLRDAEHRATLGEVARQVNHDIRNGITPLRNVMRHMAQVAEEEPQNLETVFNERRGTLEDGLSYLEDLAAHYARLSPGRKIRLVRLDEVVTQALAGPFISDQVKLENRLSVNLPPVEADPVSLRRIFDNLLRNAIESLPDGRGSVAVNAFLEEDPDLEEMRIQVEISDTGVGIPAENIDLIFNDFFTTRDEGTGLGLSNVRRLAADCGAQIRVKSEVGTGSIFTLSFPVPNP
jgi:signal transduction histidine kinase